MRRYLTGLAAAALVAVVPALAMAGDREVAESVRDQLNESGQMVHYSVNVKYHDGTVWLRGHVASQEQMAMALQLTAKTPGVQVDRIVNELTIDGEQGQAAANPLRGAKNRPGLVKRLETALRGGANEAERVPADYAQANVEQTSAEEELPRQMAAPARTAMLQPTVRGPVAPNGCPAPMYNPAASPTGGPPARYDQPCLPNYAWPSYAPYPNYASLTYPKQYSPTAWPYIGPFYPYPQVPLGWRKVTLEWDDGWWFLDFKDQPSSAWHR
ncbi:MAG: BON domain-containing protein [Planctomycetaceae bacterium]|nr:BON domain-containing protein [Planctomycetaceae bacterium]